MNSYPDKIKDWAELISGNLVDMVFQTGCYQYPDQSGSFSDLQKENPLECVLASSCAGPKSIKLARMKLGLS
jgi:hypothetical protein